MAEGATLNVSIDQILTGLDPLTEPPGGAMPIWPGDAFIAFMGQPNDVTSAELSMPLLGIDSHELPSRVQAIVTFARNLVPAWTDAAGWISRAAGQLAGRRGDEHIATIGDRRVRAALRGSCFVLEICRA